jgi:acyl transferase domain-containing protein
MCTAIQIALVDLLASWNVVSSRVIGHSSGEIAAAYSIGGLSHHSACKVAYFRGVVAASLVATSEQAGAMLAVGSSEPEIMGYILDAHLEEAISIACYNSPRSLTLSGDRVSILKLEAILKSHGLFARLVQVPVAYHSRQMNEVADDYRNLIQGLEAGTPLATDVLMYSSTTSLPTCVDDVLKESYWVQNLISPVKFLQAVSKLILQQEKRPSKTDIHLFLEIGPHSTLQGPLKDIVRSLPKSKGIAYSSLLVRNKSALDTTLDSVGKLFCMGFGVDVDTVNNPTKELKDRRMLVELPSYQFNHTKKYWLESRLSKNFRFNTFPPHEFLGTRVPDWNPLEARWRHFIRSSEITWIKDHRVSL